MGTSDATAPYLFRQHVKANKEHPVAILLQANLAQRL